MTQQTTMRECEHKWGRFYNGCGRIVWECRKCFIRSGSADITIGTEQAYNDGYMAGERDANARVKTEVNAISNDDVVCAARYRWLRDDATQKEQDRWLVRLSDDADAYADKAILSALPAPTTGEDQ